MGSFENLAMCGVPGSMMHKQCFMEAFKQTLKQILLTAEVALFHWAVVLLSQNKTSESCSVR